jgi:chemotaxis protein MotA
MISIIGILVVFGCVAGGFLMEHGKLMVLVQPAELVIILGAAIGTLVAANPIPTVMGVFKGIASLLGGGGYSKQTYQDGLKMLYDLFVLARKAGMQKLEEDIDKPEGSAVLSKYPKFLKNHHALDFLCDTLRMAVSGGVDALDLDSMMEQDLEVHHKEAHDPVSALSAMADSLPGLGIVAAVLGVVITMGSLGGPKEAIGERVAAALVGTFVGILLCYGVFGPLASAMSKQAESEGAYFGFLRMGAFAFIKGLSPIMAAELARRSIPSNVRPSFKEMEEGCRGAVAKTEAAA